MKKGITYLLIGVLLMGALSGCGGEYMGVSGRDGSVSGGAVSGQAVSGAAVSEDRKTTMKDETNWRFCTDTNLYYEDEDEDENVFLVQMRLDGSEKKKIKSKDFYELIAVEEDDIIFIQEKWDGKKECGIDSICKVPIEKDAAGYDEVRTDQVEVICGNDADREYAINSVCVDPQYILYVRGENSIRKYDRQSDQLVSDVDMGDPAVLNVKKCGNYFVLWDGWNENEELYFQEREDTDWTKGGKVQISIEQEVVFGEEMLFYENYEDSVVCQFDLKKAQEAVFITEEQIRTACAGQVGLKNIKACNLSDLWYDAGRLYVQTEVCWMQKGIYHMAYYLFSQAPEETGLRYEKEVTESMHSRGTVREGKWITGPDYHWETERVAVEHAAVNDAQCYRIMNGKAFFSIYDYKKKKGQAACYHLKTGEFRWLTKKDQEYYETWYETAGGFWDYGNEGNTEVLGKDPERIDFSYAPFAKEDEYAVRFEEKEK